MSKEVCADPYGLRSEFMGRIEDALYARVKNGDIGFATPLCLGQDNPEVGAVFINEDNEVRMVVQESDGEETNLPPDDFTLDGLLNLLASMDVAMSLRSTDKNCRLLQYGGQRELADF